MTWTPVPAEDLRGRPDLDIWEAAQREQRFLVTQDLDFSDIRQFRPGTHHGLLLARLARPGRGALLERVYQLFVTEKPDAWAGCFAVATEVKLRVFRPDATDEDRAPQKDK
jgi:Domain of unknown function (DUF5615)